MIKYDYHNMEYPAKVSLLIVRKGSLRKAAEALDLGHSTLQHRLDNPDIIKIEHHLAIDMLLLATHEGKLSIEHIRLDQRPRTRRKRKLPEDIVENVLADLEERRKLKTQLHLFTYRAIAERYGLSFGRVSWMDSAVTTEEDAL